MPIAVPVPVPRGPTTFMFKSRAGKRRFWGVQTAPCLPKTHGKSPLLIFILAPPPPGGSGGVRTVIFLRRSGVLGRFRHRPRGKSFRLGGWGRYATGYLKAVWPDFLGLMGGSGGPRGPGKASRGPPILVSRPKRGRYPPPSHGLVISTPRACAHCGRTEVPRI